MFLSIKWDTRLIISKGKVIKIKVIKSSYKFILSLIMACIIMVVPFNFANDDFDSNYRKLNLSIEEIDYLKEVGTITYFSKRDLLPVEYVGIDGQAKGIGPEYIQKVEEMLGIKFKVHSKNNELNWNEKIKMINNNQVDLISSVVYDHSLSADMYFSDSYYMEDVIILGDNSSDPITKIGDFYEKTLVVPIASWQERYISSYVEDVKIIEVEGVMEALEYVDVNENTYTILEDSSYLYYLRENGYKNIHKKGNLDIKGEYRFAFSRDNNILRDIFNKVIEYIPREEMYKQVLAKEVEKDKKPLYLAIGISILLGATVIYLGYRLYRDYEYKKKLRENKEALIENLSHDLKTPLSNLKINFGLIKRGIIKEDDLDGYYSKLDRNIDNLNEIIDDLYGVNEIKESYNPKENKRVDIHEYLQGIYFEHKSSLEDKKRKFTYNNNLKKDCYVKISEKDILRSINNIISNALKYTEENDSIVISVNEEKRNILISIYDSGCGIEKGELNNIFDRFYQVKNDKLKPGKGLGLSISKEIIEAHGGRISVSSREGVYTEFIISLPMS